MRDSALTVEPVPVRALSGEELGQLDGWRREGLMVQAGEYLDFTDEVHYWEVMDRWPTLVMLRDPFRGVIIKCNTGYAALLHWSKSDLEGKKLVNFFGSKVSAEYQDADIRVLQTGVAKLSVLERVPVYGYGEYQVLAHKQLVLYNEQPAVLVHAEVLPEKLVTGQEHRRLRRIVYGLLGLQVGQLAFGSVTLHTLLAWALWLAKHLSIGFQ